MMIPATDTYRIKHKSNKSTTEKLPSHRGKSTVAKDLNDSYTGKINFNGAEADAFMFADSVYGATGDP